jgi:hypothetical protein
MRAFTDDLKFTFAEKEGLCVELKKSGAGAEPEDDDAD